MLERACVAGTIVRRIPFRIPLKRKQVRPINSSEECYKGSIPPQAQHDGIEPADLRDTARAHTAYLVGMLCGRGVVLESAPCRSDSRR